MPMIGNQTLTESDMWGATPVDLLLCRISLKRCVIRASSPRRAKTVRCSSRLAGRHELGQRLG
jgi:glucose dehydrogenase